MQQDPKDCRDTTAKCSMGRRSCSEQGGWGSHHKTLTTAQVLAVRSSLCPGRPTSCEAPNGTGLFQRREAAARSVAIAEMRGTAATMRRLMFEAAAAPCSMTSS